MKKVHKFYLKNRKEFYTLITYLFFIVPYLIFNLITRKIYNNYNGSMLVIMNLLFLIMMLYGVYKHNQSEYYKCKIRNKQRKRMKKWNQ